MQGFSSTEAIVTSILRSYLYATACTNKLLTLEAYDLILITISC